MNTASASTNPSRPTSAAITRFVCAGEILLRLAAPRGEILLQTPRLEASFGGAEANVGVALAHLGHAAAMLGAVPDHAVGSAAVADLARHGIDTRFVARLPGRLGSYYLEAAAGLRAPRVVYDRADSCFARCPASALQIDAALTGAEWLHLSGITPALGAGPTALAQQLLAAATRHGTRLSFDTNYRATLWGGRVDQAAAILRQFAQHAEVLFADERILMQMLGNTATSPTGAPADPAGALADAAQRAFAAWPTLQYIATTTRRELHAEHHELQGLLATRSGIVRSRSWDLPAIVERIGSGDAFAAGILHALARGMTSQGAVDFAVAAACLKHYIVGDACIASETDVAALLAGASYGVRR